MGLFDILAKLGILRFGTKKAVWHGGKDMPAEMLMDNVYNAERDLTTREDLKKVAATLAGGKATGAGEHFCPNCGAKVKADSRFCTECGNAIAR
jgi:ribosomal protein S27AE